VVVGLTTSRPTRSLAFFKSDQNKEREHTD
jgi:hypothetical protein